MTGLRAIMWREGAVSLRPLTLMSYFIAPLFYVVFFAVAITTNVRSVPYGSGLVRYDRFFLPGLIAIQSFMLFSLTFSLVRLDRATKVMTLITISRVPVTTYYFGKLLMAMLMSFLKALLIILVAFLFTGQAPSLSLGSFAWMSTGIVLGTTVWLSLGFVAAAYISREDTRDLVFTLLTLPTTFASSAYYNLALTPAWVRVVGAVNPLTYTSDLIRLSYLPTQSVSPWALLAGLSAWAVISMTLALRSLGKLVAP